MQLKPIETLTENEAQLLKLLRKKGGRDRYQEGSLEEVGKKRKGKRWRGHYYVYVSDGNGERRVHKTVGLGLVSDISRPEAKKLLREHIASIATEVSLKPAPSAAPGELKPSADATLQQFWDLVFLPMYKTHWKESSQKEIIGNIRRYVLKKFGERRLAEISKFAVQTHINDLAEAGFSKSVIEKARIWSNVLLEEAEEQGFIAKNPLRTRNPLRKISFPQGIKPVNKSVARIAELQKGFARLPLRERLVIRFGLVLGLRPGEILALRRNDISNLALRIDENARYGKTYEPKTEASNSSVWMTPEIAADLKEYLASKGLEPPEAFIFSGRRKQVYRLDNYRALFFKPALKAAGIEGLTMQMCRRSCATFMNDGKHGNPKDIQNHLRHAQIATTMDVYVQAVPESVRKAVESLDNALFGFVNNEQENPVQ